MGVRTDQHLIRVEKCIYLHIKFHLMGGSAKHLHSHSHPHINHGSIIVINDEEMIDVYIRPNPFVLPNTYFI